VDPGDSIRATGQLCSALFNLKLATAGKLTFEDRRDFRAVKLVVAGSRDRLDYVRKAVAGKAELLGPIPPGYLKTRCAAGSASSTIRPGSRISPT